MVLPFQSLMQRVLSRVPSSKRLRFSKQAEGTLLKTLLC
jgi:hypothetical protein